MAAFTHCPGPKDLYVRFRNGVTSYLGTATIAPEFDHQWFYLEVFNDLGGRSVPFQHVYDGERATVAVTMDRFDYTVFKAIRALTRVPGDVGKDKRISRGTVVVANSDFQFIVHNTYAGAANANTLALAQADFPETRRYHSAFLAAAKETNAGTRVEEIALVIATANVFTPSTREFDLFSEGETAASLGLTPN